MRYPLLFILCISFIACTTDACTIDAFEPSPIVNINPTKKFIAVTYDNAMHSPSEAHLSIHKYPDSSFNGDGNVFIASSANGVDVLTDTTFYCRWFSDSTLTVAYDKRLKIIKQEFQSGPVKIRYMVW